MQTSMILAATLLSIVTAGCSSSVSEPAPTGDPAAQATARAPRAMRAGYVHTVEHSRFDVGAAPSERLEFGMHKVVGRQGVFATRPTGLTLALSNADAATRQKGPLAGGADAHDAAVRDYFVRAGLPLDQVAGVSPYAVVSVEGANPANPAEGLTAPPTGRYYFSVISRQIDGIPVADSFAWARLDADGGVVLESVYWPAIPAAVVEQAKQARNAGAGPAGGRLVIHHPPGEWDGAFDAVVSYDVEADGSRVSHVGLDSKGLELEHEKSGAWGATASDPRAFAR
jgi:hypothetical protein